MCVFDNDDNNDAAATADDDVSPLCVSPCVSLCVAFRDGAS